MPDHTLPFFRPQTETKEIPLTQGKVAIVDASDFDWLMQWGWYARRDKDLFYAARNLRLPDGGRKPLQMHRAIIAAGPLEKVDHVNGDGLDNTRSNLRTCTHQENMRNRSATRVNASGYKGVCFRVREQRWIAYIRVSGKTIHLGYFGNAEEAAMAYDVAARNLFGEFARTNF